jgi:hypothetical protein
LLEHAENEFLGGHAVLEGVRRDGGELAFDVRAGRVEVGEEERRGLRALRRRRIG